jgi:carbamoyltransferase
VLILGISAFYHDSAVAIIRDGEILYAAQEERFTRIKNDPSFPINAILNALDYCNLSIGEIDCISFYDKPFLKFERIIENQLDVMPRAYTAYLKNIPSWLGEKLFVERTIRKKLKKAGIKPSKSCNFVFPEHHLSHAASAFYPSAFTESAILTIDGIGEYDSTAIYYGKDHAVTKKAHIKYPNSLGLLYSAFTYFLGFKVNTGEYKMMGLAPYGNITDSQTVSFIDKIKNEILKDYSQGILSLNMKYFKFQFGKKMIRTSKWVNLFGIAKRSHEDIDQSHANLALAIQKVTEELILMLANRAKEITNSQNICLAGGVALNSVANGALVRSGLFENVFVQPAAGDAGGAVGAALAAYHIYYEKERTITSPDGLKNSLLGPAAKRAELDDLITHFPNSNRVFANDDELCEFVSTQLSQNKTIGWVQGRMEFGPRALGARSILANPKDETVQKRLNLQVKQRESFRPFAPIILEEDLNKLSSVNISSPYMLQVHPVNPELIKEIPEGYKTWNIKEKLDFVKSDLPAITHVDFSARIQTISDHSPNRIRLLLKKMKEKNGIGVLVNTSFNSNEEPIVNTVSEALSCFTRSGLDFLVVENTVVWNEEVD